MYTVNVNIKEGVKAESTASNKEAFGTETPSADDNTTSSSESQDKTQKSRKMAERDAGYSKPITVEDIRYSRKTGRSAVYYAYEIMDMFGIKKDAKNRDSFANTLEQMLNSVRADGEYMNDDFMRLMAEKAADLILPDVKRRRSDRANEILREIRGGVISFSYAGKNAGQSEYNFLVRQ